MNLDHIRKSIKGEEGLSLVPYRCSKGYWTVGRGHRLTNGATSTAISEEFAEALYEGDFKDALGAAEAWCGKEVWDKLCDARQHCLIDMQFNMGADSMAKFVRLHAAVLAGDWERAAHEIQDSQYWQDVPNRARRNYMRMLTGKEPEEGPRE